MDKEMRWFMADHLWLFCVFGFVFQMMFSCLKGKLWIRLVPMLGIAGCMVFWMLHFFFTRDPYSLLYYIGWGAVLLSAGMAWVMRVLVIIFKESKE